MHIQIILCILWKNYTSFYDHLTEFDSMELYSMELHLKSHYKAFHFHQYFHYILQLIYQLFYFCTYSFYTLSILLYFMIYHIRTHN